MNNIKDYTHIDAVITDIRLKKGKNEKDAFFAIKIKTVDDVIFVNYNIFNDRIKAYFLGKSVRDVGREEILKLKWNFIITKGHYLKIMDKSNFSKVNAEENKSYISVLDVTGFISEFKNNFTEEVKIQTHSSVDA